MATGAGERATPGGSGRGEAHAREALTAALASIDTDGVVANYLIRGASIFDGEPRRIDFEADLADEVVVDVLGYASRLADLELVPYDPTFQPSSGQALVDRLDQVPELARLHRMIAADAVLLDSADADSGDGGDGGDRKIAALVHRVDGVSADLNSAITAYRLKGPGIATKRPGGLRVLLPRGGVYERVTDELIYYQPRFDAIVVAGYVFVTTPMTLQRNLGSDARARTLARETLERATTRIEISGADELADAVSHDPAMIAKMMQLHRTLAADPDYADALTTARLVDFLDENPHIPIELEGAGDDRRLVFDPAPQKRYLIPKALADDFLRSDLTSRRYEVGSKQRLDR